jgi:ProP effector
MVILGIKNKVPFQFEPSIKGYPMRHQELHPRTAIINKKQKIQAKKTRNDALIWLAKTFPHAFDNRIMIHPLKLGIMADILTHAESAAKEGISKSKLREAVVIFTRRIDYLTCLKARETRIDLEGHPVGPVTDEEAANAAMKITRRVEKAAKNTKKLAKNPLTSKQPDPSQVSADVFPHYPARAPKSEESNYQPKTSNIPAIHIKHKVSRAYDPSAVARLKEKLGLSRKNLLSDETTK